MRTVQMRERSPEARMAYYEGRLAALVSRAAVLDGERKKVRQQMRLVRSFWRVARQDSLRSRAPTRGEGR
jgi:hypothetical protein